jgi:hypothetical protein
MRTDVLELAKIVSALCNAGTIVNVVLKVKV